MSQQVTDYGSLRFREDYQISSLDDLQHKSLGFDRYGYELCGWIDQNGNTYGPEGIINSKEDIRLSAQWKQMCLRMTAADGNVYSFKYSELSNPGVLQYNNDRGEVLEPFNSNASLSNYLSCVAVDDDGGEILSIGYEAFFVFPENLSSVNCPNAQNIGYGAFNSCTNLTFINCQKVQNIEDYAFYNCISLSSIDCPELKSVGYYSFNCCKNLVSINCPNVQNIDNQAFYKCANLTSINCQNLQCTRYAAFEACSNLISIDCPNIQHIAYCTFTFCSGLTSINCQKVQEIGQNTFDHCASLSSINMSAIESIPTLYNINAFNDTPNGISCYVPSSLCADFYTADNWSDLLAQNPPKFKMIGV